MRLRIWALCGATAVMAAMWIESSVRESSYVWLRHSGQRGGLAVFSEPAGSELALGYAAGIGGDIYLQPTGGFEQFLRRTLGRSELIGPYRPTGRVVESGGHRWSELLLNGPMGGSPTISQIPPWSAEESSGDGVATPR